MTRLQRCRTLWGEAAVTADLPELEVVTDAVYLPCRHDGPWGLFSAGRCLGGTGHGLAEGDTGSLPDPAETAPEADYLYIGPLVPHYGHFLTDTLSRFWPLAAWDGPPPKLLCHPLGPHGEPEPDGFLAAILAGLGLRDADLVAFEHPVRIRRAIVPAPSFVTQARAHAVFAALCRGIGRGWFSDGEIDAVARPVYLSKARLDGGIGRLRDEERVAAELDRRGVEIVHPETLAFPEQVRLFAARRTILGTAGSAFHTSLFSAPERRIVGLNWAEPLNANFPLFDRLNRNRAYYYWANGTTYEAEGPFGVRWTVPEPERVAAELLERAEAFDRLDARDAEEEVTRAREARRLGMRLRRWTRRIAGTLSRRP